MNSIDDIIEKIVLLQKTANRNYFPSGIFESYRRNFNPNYTLDYVDNFFLQENQSMT